MHPDRAAIHGTGVEFTGVLIADARAAVKMLDGEGNTVPVIMLEIESESGMHMPLHIDQAFPVGHMDQAEAAARRYRKGQRVTVLTSALSVRLAATAVHIHTLHENETKACPASPSSP